MFTVATSCLRPISSSVWISRLNHVFLKHLCLSGCHCGSVFHALFVYLFRLSPCKFVAEGISVSVCVAACLSGCHPGSTPAMSAPLYSQPARACTPPSTSPAPFPSPHHSHASLYVSLIYSSFPFYIPLDILQSA